MIAVAKKKDIDPEFGRRLRHLREHAGLTLIELGERAGMVYTSIGRLERGEREPTWATIVRLADALGVDLNAFREPKSNEGAVTEDDVSPPPRPRGKFK